MKGYREGVNFSSLPRARSIDHHLLHGYSRGHTPCNPIFKSQVPLERSTQHQATTQGSGPLGVNERLMRSLERLTLFFMA